MCLRGVLQGTSMNGLEDAMVVMVVMVAAVVAVVVVVVVV